MILGAQALNEYIVALAKSLYTQGFDLMANPTAEIDEAGFMAFSVIGVVDEGDSRARTELGLDEIWRPLPEARWQRREYAYDLIDYGRLRRRAFHLHDRDAAEARFGTVVHEHCEELLGAPDCGHYIGREVPDGYSAIRLLIAAWLEPEEIGCSQLTCLD